jgi:hypothetical protein
VPSRYFIIVVPADMPLTRPEELPIVATEVLLLLQVPPGVASDSVVVAPRQMLKRPVIGGDELMVTDLIALQPVPSVYIMVSIPPASPVTIPVPVPTRAIEVLLLLHTPPEVASVSANVSPEHTVALPFITAGTGNTVTDP